MKPINVGSAFGAAVAATTFIAFVLGASRPSSARQTDDPRLSATYQIEGGTITLAELADKISATPGIKVAVSEAIQGHRITVSPARVQLRALLDSLAELNGWRWIKEQDQIVIARHVFRPRNTAEEMAAEMRRALPRDVLDYLRLAGIEKADTFQREQTMMSRDPGERVSECRQALVDTVGRHTASGAKAIKFTDLSAKQKQDLAFMIFFQKYDDAFTVIFNRQGTHWISPDRAVVHLNKGKILMIQMFVRPDYPIGFGANVVDFPNDVPIR